jgi:hypothetical protein
MSDADLDYLHADHLDRETVDFIKRCIVDRVFFVRWVLKAQPDEWQEGVLRALDAGETRISIRSGHGVGKTALCAWIALHFLLFRKGTKIAITAPSGAQLKDGLIPEVNLWIDRLPEGLGLKECLDVKAERISRNDDKANNFMSFRTARIEAPEALAGIHAKNVLVIVDEASGVPEVIYEAGSGTMSTKGAIIILIGNPTRSRGYFHRTQTKMADYWWTQRVSCLDSPRVDETFIEDIRRTYGENSNQWRVRVQGEFPDSDDDAVIPRELAESLLDRDIILDPMADRVWGVDPGRGGDATGFICRTHEAILDIAQWHDANLMKIVSRIQERWMNCLPSERPSAIYVDSIGLGAGLADRLRELQLPVVDVNVSETAAMKDRFPRMRPELWFAIRDWLNGRNVTCSSDLRYAEELVEELCLPEMKLLGNGKTDIESKRDMQLRGLASPNLGDALALTFAHHGAAASGRYNTTAWNAPLTRNLQGVY